MSTQWKTFHPLGAVAVVLLLVAVGGAAESAEHARPNVLFIAVDDLRPQLGCYGHPQMRSPNIDRLASSGFRFGRAYCNVPVCGASRASLMTGIRPARNRFVTYSTWAEKDAPGITTLNTHFRSHGYYTISLGKVFHHARDNVQGWSEEPWLPQHLQGRSFVPLMKDPNLPWKEAAIGRFHSGDTLRTDRHRFTEYTDGQGKLLGRMLYDHETDPGENVNISERPQSAELNGTLRAQLREGMGKP